MTVPTTTSAAVYTGTGVLASYPFTWLVPAAADLVVYRQDTAGNIALLALTTDYTVSGVGNPTGGTITLVAGNLTTGYRLFIASDPAEIQPLLIAQGSGWNPADLMAQLDQLTRMVQATRRVAQNAIGVPLAESLDGRRVTLPAAALRANGFLGFDASGNAQVATPATTAIPTTGLVQVLDSIAALKALAVPVGAVTFFVRGYYAAGDGGGGWFRWNAGDATADNGGTVIALNAGGAGRFNRIYVGVMTPEWFGAKGDQTVTDDTAAFTAAIAQIASDGGGELYCRKKYRIRTQLVLTSGMRISGPGQLYLDPAANVYSMIVTSGAEAAGLALAANLLKGTRVATLASTASFSVGQVVALRAAAKFGGSYPYSSLEVVSKTTTQLTFKQAVTCDYLTADSAVVVGMTMVADVSLVGIEVLCAPNSDINYPLRFNHAQRLKVSGVAVLNHNVTTTPADAAGMVSTNFLDIEFDRCSANCVSVQSCGIEAYGGSDCRIINCDSTNYDFGIEVSLTSGATMGGNTSRSGTVKAGNRGMKIKGTWDATVTGNEVIGFDTGMKIEESRDYTITGNTFAYVGFDSSSACINVSNQVAAAGEMGGGTIGGNTLRGLTGNGILLDAGNSFVVITANEIEDVQGAGIFCQAPDCTISFNQIRDWGKAYVGANDQLYAGINAPVTKTTLIGNRFANAVLNTVPDVATTITDGTLIVDGNYSDTNNIVFFSSSNKPPLNGFKLGPTSFGVVDASRPYATALGGCPQTKTVLDAGAFTFTKQEEGCFFIVTVGTAGSALSGLFFCDTATGAVALVSDPSGTTFSATSGHAATCNAFKGAGSNTITIENKLGATKAIRVAIVGSRLASVT